MNAWPVLKLRVAALASRFLLLLAVTLATMLSGCSGEDGPGGPAELRVYYAPELHSVISPDSVAVGDTVQIESWIIVGGCQAPERAVVTMLEPGHVRIQLVASRPFRAGTCNTGIWGTPLFARVPVGVAGTWRFDVVGRTSKSVEVVVAARPGGP